MSVQVIYQTYLKYLSVEERKELIHLLVDETMADAIPSASTDIPLSAEEKIQLSNRLRAEATQAQWAALSEQLPDVPEITMDEIVAEVKMVRKQRSH